MDTYGLLEPVSIHDHRVVCAETDPQVPCVVTAMLQNVYLYREKTTPPVEHRGDFWYWKLTPYGLDLMRVLVRASAAGFPYAETFMEPDPEAVPQLALLGRLNVLISAHLTHTVPLPDWAASLDHSAYLRDQKVVIDATVFQRELDGLIAQIRRGCYDLAGNRVYPTMQRTDPEASAAHK